MSKWTRLETDSDSDTDDEMMITMAETIVNDYECPTCNESLLDMNKVYSTAIITKYDLRDEREWEIPIACCSPKCVETTCKAYFQIRQRTTSNIIHTLSNKGTDYKNLTITMKEFQEDKMKTLLRSAERLSIKQLQLHCLSCGRQHHKFDCESQFG